MDMSKRGLGRGLEALIPDTSALRPEESDRILSLSVDAIQPNPHQPRRDFAIDELDALAESIRAQGLLQPVIVRPLGGDRYQLIAGERRWRAAARAGFERVPALIRKTEDDEMLPLALVENLLRADLNPIEEARAYQDLVDGAGWTQELVATKVGKSRAHVANTLRLLHLPAEVQEDVASGALSAGHARALLACESPEAMYALRRRILTEGLTVRDTESVVSPTPTPRARRRRDDAGGTIVRTSSPETRELEERLQRLFGTAVRIEDRGGRGRVALEFYSYDDLTRLADLLLAAGESSPLGGDRR
jgi:ParB family chromosome partitioning protein